MKKRLISLTLACSLISAPAFAWGPREQGILAGAAGLWIYQQLSKPPVVVQQQSPVIVQQPPVVYQTPRTVYVYPTNVPVPPGMVCNLHSENINGQIVTGNYCFYH